MSIADELALLANTKENLRLYLGLSKDVPFSQYASYSMRWNPSALFTSGEQGAWYDPSDLSTLFQDSTGTTQVTADGDPVGLMLDKSGNGNHASQSISSYRPTYQRGDSRGVVNLLRWSEDYTKTQTWNVVAGVSLATAEITPPDGVSTVTRVTMLAGVSNKSVRSVSTLQDKRYQYTVHIKPDDHLFFQVANQAKAVVVNVDMSDWSFSVIGGTADVGIEQLADGWARLSVGFSDAYPGIYNSLVGSKSAPRLEVFSGAGSIYMAGSQVVPLGIHTPYQRNDGHLGGVSTGQSTDLHWLRDDKLDDLMTAPLPAMPTATIIRGTDDGVTTAYPVSIPGGIYSVDTTSTLGFDYGRVIVNRELSVEEQSSTVSYYEEKVVNDPI